MNPLSEIPLRRATEREVAEEWELVLIAEGFSPKVWPDGEGFVVGVPSDQVERAQGSLSAYERENPIQPPQEIAPASISYPITGIVVAGALLVFFFITGPPALDNPWFEGGSSDAGQILHGELWRSVTALTLHSDIAHVLANSAALALFLTGLCSSLGPGIAGALILIAGVTGNLTNAWVHGPYHLSIGASTAVFGAVGLLGGIRATGSYPGSRRRHRFWIPLGASLALLAMLGTNGPPIDFWGHFFGLLAGSLVGIATAPLLPRPPRPMIQWAAGFSSIVALAVSWSFALR